MRTTYSREHERSVQGAFKGRIGIQACRADAATAKGLGLDAGSVEFQQTHARGIKEIPGRSSKNLRGFLADILRKFMIPRLHSPQIGKMLQKSIISY